MPTDGPSVYLRPGIYLKRAFIREYTVCHYVTPPNHRVVIHSNVIPTDYSTLSLKGVTRLLNGKDAEFTELNQWIKDYKHFQELIKIKTFTKFRIWKAFSVWRKNVRWR